MFTSNSEKNYSRCPDSGLEKRKKIQKLQKNFLRNACVLAAVEKIFKTLEEKVQSLNDKISAQQSKIEELAQKNLSPKTKEESAQTEKIERQFHYHFNLQAVGMAVARPQGFESDSRVHFTANKIQNVTNVKFRSLA